MMELLYGTYNPAKLEAMRRWLAPLPIRLMGLTDLDAPPADVEESGHTPLENARLKAAAYRDATGRTTLAADSGLYIEGLPDDQQPGEHARRRQGRRMDDEEMIAYYAGLVQSLGGRAVARYRNALCLAFLDGRVMERFDDSIASAPFYLMDTPHPRRTKGFPLDSLSAQIESGRYYYDIEHGGTDGDLAQQNGFTRFVAEAMGLTR